MCKERPGHFVVVFAIRLDKRCLPGDGTALAFVAAGIVIKGNADGTGLQMFDIIPADGLIGAVTAGSVRAVDVKDKAVFQVSFTRGTRQANAHQPFAWGKDNATVLIVPGVRFVLAHHRELNTVDGE